jgi:hypothetical protein
MKGGCPEDKMRQKGKIRYILYAFLTMVAVFCLYVAFSDMTPVIEHHEKTLSNEIFKK